MIFVHGYSVNLAWAMQSSADFFKNIQGALKRDGASLSDFGYVGFTWPGDVGTLWFDDGQIFAQHSGVALYRFVKDLGEQHGVNRMTLVAHSLGAHVSLRSATVLGERFRHKKAPVRYTNIILLAPAVENDVFRRPIIFGRYHFPEAAFGMNNLHIFISRADQVLRKAYAASEKDAALGYAGPESMRPLQSLSRRVTEVLGPEYLFNFETHDFSPTSTVIMNPALHAHGHSDYWTRPAQADYYVNILNQSL